MHRSKEQIAEEVREIRAAQQSSEKFAVLYDRYFTQIFFFIYRRVNDKDLSGDLCSRTFLKAMVNIKKYKPKGVPFSAWLFRIAINEINIYFRDNRRVQLIGLKEAVATEIINETTQTDDESNRKLLLKALNSLPVRDTEIVEMRFFEQLSFREIAAVLDIREPAAKLRTYRALHKLKKLISEMKG